MAAISTSDVFEDGGLGTRELSCEKENEIRTKTSKVVVLRTLIDAPRLNRTIYCHWAQLMETDESFPAKS